MAVKSAAFLLLKEFLKGAPGEPARGLESAAELLERARAAPAGSTLPVAVPALEGLLPGGLPRGEIVEITGPRSSGRFSLALSLLAAATSVGEAAALVDLGDHFDPQAAEAAGTSLPRLLWLRPRTLRQALLSAETAVAAGIPFVLLDLGLAASRISLRERARHDFAFLRLARAARAHDTALVVLSPRRTTGAAARVVLAAAGARPAWSLSRAGSVPLVPLLLGLAARLVPEKLPFHRPGAAGGLQLRLEETISANEGTTNSDRQSPSYGHVETHSHENRLPPRPDVPARRTAP
jgi:hypothetical protein